MVIDNGSSYFKCGLASHERPQLQVDSIMNFNLSSKNSTTSKHNHIIQGGKIIDINNCFKQYKKIYGEFYGEDFRNENLPPILTLDSMNIDESTKKEFIQI